SVPWMNKVFPVRTEDNCFLLWHYRNKLKRPWKPVKNSFQGNTVLLTSGNTYSAASEFAGIFEEEKRGPIVGEETGGYNLGSTGYTSIVLELPNTKSTIKIPLIITRNNVKN